MHSPSSLILARRRTGTLLTSLGLLSLAAVPLAAAEMVVSDLRLGVGVLSSQYKGSSSTTITNSSNNVISSSSSGDGRDADENWRGQLQYVGGRLGEGGGLIWGVGVAVNHATWDNDGSKAHVTTPVIDVLLGYGYAVTPTWHFELTPFAGIGRAYYSVTDNGSTDTSEEWEHYVEYGAKLGTYVALGESTVLGVEIPYLMGAFEPDYEYSDSGNNNVTVSDERRNQGFGLLVTLGMRF